MATIVFVVAFIVALCLACTLVLGFLWLMDKSYERAVRKRRATHAAEERSWEDRWTPGLPTVEKAPDWDFPERWSPTKGESHLGKTTLGEDNR